MVGWYVVAKVFSVVSSVFLYSCQAWNINIWLTAHQCLFCVQKLARYYYSWTAGELVNILSAHPVAPWNVIFECSLCIPEQDSSLRLLPMGRPALSRALCLIPDLQQSVYSAVSETCGGKQPMWQRFTSTGMSACHSASLWLCPWKRDQERERQDKQRDRDPLFSKCINCCFLCLLCIFQWLMLTATDVTWLYWT